MAAPCRTAVAAIQVSWRRRRRPRDRSADAMRAKQLAVSASIGSRGYVACTRESVESRMARASGLVARNTPNSSSAAVITETAICSGSSPSSRPVSWAMKIEVSAIARFNRRARHRGHRRDRPAGRRRRAPQSQCGATRWPGPRDRDPRRGEGCRRLGDG